MSIATSLRSVRLAKGINATTLARRGKTSKAAISQIEHQERGVSVSRLESLLRVTRDRLVIVPTMTSTPAEVAEEIKVHLEQGKKARAYRLLLSFSDALHGEKPEVRVALCLTPPLTTGSALFDAALASVVEFALRGLPQPQWLTDQWRFLSEAEVLTEGNITVVPEPGDVPAELKHHGVLIDERSLVGV